MVTLAPAEAWGFTDRGLLREGLAADINIFDPDRITPTLPVLLHDLPTGAPRLESRAEGILATIVGGAITIQRGEHTVALPGRLLPRPPSTAPATDRRAMRTLSGNVALVTGGRSGLRRCQGRAFG